MASNALAIVGLIRNAQGIRGEVVVESLTDAPDAVFASGRRVFAGDSEGDSAEANPLTVESATPFKGGIRVKFAEIGDRNQADQMRGRYLFSPFDELEPPRDDEVYLHELIGMKVKLENGTDIGKVAAYYELPQGLTLDVDTRKGSVLVPYRPEVIAYTDSDAREIIAKADTGIFD